ncbi:alpha/beta fold hydrolase [Ramlibacter sp. AN1133]|uniref:alpha/beta fold hydrolase n=1 Tax=Ramlibacter sp. AN1133 TaxID=3133429 RepID=UPI0030BB122D
MPQFAPTLRARLPALRARQTRSGRLGYILSGHGPAHIVLFSGAGMSLKGWEALYPGIERIGRVLGWNRFGLQGSDAPRGRQTGTLVLGSLRELLASTGLGPPYVLVAHSLGGLFANLYARLYPREVAGVVLIEATHPGDHVALKKHETQIERALARLLALPNAFFRRNLHAELAGVEDTVRELEAAGPFPDVPLRVITGGLTPRAGMMSPGAVGARRANQQELARLSPLGQQVIAQRSGHFPQMTQPQLVLRVLEELLAQVRTS